MQSSQLYSMYTGTLNELMSLICTKITQRINVLVCNIASYPSHVAGYEAKIAYVQIIHNAM